jgi:hypothetical protein
LVPNIDCNALREVRAKNLDLWVKGELYPVHPMSNSHPDFKTITRLCRYVCHGKSGLLGYCKNLEGNHISLEQKIQDLNIQLQQLHRSNMIQYHENMRLNKKIAILSQIHVEKLLEVKSISSKEIEKLKTDISRP